MLKKWRMGENHPSHETIHTLLDLCEYYGITDVKFDWNSYVEELLSHTRYMMVDEINPDRDTHVDSITDWKGW